MTFVQIYLLTALGIAISVLLPIIRAALPKPPAGLNGFASPTVSDAMKGYLVLALFSLVGAVLVVAAAKDSLTDWRAAVLAGYAWDSTLQKLKPLV
jgi:hypothetical protein